MTDTDKATVQGLEMATGCRAPGGCSNFPECYAVKECLHEPDAYSGPKEELA